MRGEVTVCTSVWDDTRCKRFKPQLLLLVCYGLEETSERQTITNTQARHNPGYPPLWSASYTDLANVFDKLQCGVLQQQVRTSKNGEQFL